MSLRATAAAQRPQLKRALRKLTELRVELARIADGLQADPVGSFRLEHVDQVDELADFLRDELATAPSSLSVFVTTTHPTTPAAAGQEDHRGTKDLRR